MRGMPAKARPTVTFSEADSNRHKSGGGGLLIRSGGHRGAGLGLGGTFDPGYRSMRLSRCYAVSVVIGEPSSTTV